MYNKLNTANPRDKCGVCGVCGHPEAARLTYFGLYALQHRGQNSAGMVSHDGSGTWTHKAIGLVFEVFTEEHLQSLKGDAALGHVLDSSPSDISILNIQPFTATHRGRTPYRWPITAASPTSTSCMLIFKQKVLFFTPKSAAR